MFHKMNKSESVLVTNMTIVTLIQRNQEPSRLSSISCSQSRCYAAEFRTFCGSLTVLLISPVWEFVLF